ncbi:MAG: helix-turn-helix domain-containing protein [Candidatus Lokiarchaeota archaeon]|nr:helix-turn-helix domain-containing protein [Candidatus Lokiarchaeota archaeon]
MSAESGAIKESGKADPAIIPKSVIKSVFIGGGIALISVTWLGFIPEPGMLFWSLISTVMIIIGTVVITAIYMPAFVRNFSYDLSDKFIVIKRGVITKQKTTIPFSRIQNVSVIQGPFDRKYGIYTVKVETAGFSAAGGGQGGPQPEGLLVGIKDPKKLESIIDELVHQYTQKPKVPENLKGKVFEETDLAFDQFISTIMSKMQEGDAVKNNIKELRDSRNMTQEQLAERVGVTRQTILYLEKGTYNPSLKLAMKIAQVFGVKVESLFELEDEDS